MKQHGNSTSDLTLIEQRGDVAIVSLNSLSSAHNPISQPIMKEFSRKMQLLDKEPAVKAIVVYGGKNRSFSAGGDFNEVQKFTGGKGEIRE